MEPAIEMQCSDELPRISILPNQLVSSDGRLGTLFLSVLDCGFHHFPSAINAETLISNLAASIA
eukprot:11176096-Karenia_brevis.AAC.1